jgi:hypothetical protein
MRIATEEQLKSIPKFDPEKDLDLDRINMSFAFKGEIKRIKNTKNEVCEVDNLLIKFANELGFKDISKIIYDKIMYSDFIEDNLVIKSVDKNFFLLAFNYNEIELSGFFKNNIPRRNIARDGMIESVLGLSCTYEPEKSR